MIGRTMKAALNSKLLFLRRSLLLTVSEFAHCLAIGAPDGPKYFHADRGDAVGNHLLATFIVNPLGSEPFA